MLEALTWRISFCDEDRAQVRSRKPEDQGLHSRRKVLRKLRPREIETSVQGLLLGREISFYHRDPKQGVLY